MSVGRSGKKLSAIDKLEYNISEPVGRVVEMLRMPLTDWDLKPLKTPEELERELLGIGSDFWVIAKHRSRGMSISQICRQFGNKYSASEVSWMIKKVLNVNHGLAVHDGELLREGLLMELDGYLNALYIEASTKYSSEELVGEQIPKALGIFDRKLKLLGVEAPTRVDVTVTNTINAANERLDEQLSKFNANRRIVEMVSGVNGVYEESTGVVDREIAVDHE
jgi:phage tail protein X